MTSSEITSAYIKKLIHPLKEIRERSLQLLIAKIRLGWEFEDELSGTRELLEVLMAWFQPQEPTLQKEALELLLTIIKTKSGTYIARELGIQKLISNLSEVKNKIAPTAIEMLEDVLETLRFLNTVDSEVNCIPHLRLHSENSSSNGQSSASNGQGSASNGQGSAFYNLGLTKETSDETSVSNEDIQIYTNNNNTSDFDGVIMLLFPWVDLNPSDLKTMLLIEYSLKLLKSTRRCCRFIRNVFLRDFPPEIFLNRPVIVKTLLGIADGQISGKPGEALQVLLCITESLHMRFLKLFSLDLVSKPHKVPDDHRDSDDNINIELATFADGNCHIQQDEALVALRQFPAPLFALETSHTVLTIMARSVLYVDTNDQEETSDMKDLNTCLSLIESLIELLLDCVNEYFWSLEHTSKTHRDIAHKASVVMRMLGDLLTKYSKSFYEDTNNMHHRAAYLRLVPCGEMLLSWAKRCALPPSSLVKALQVAQIDPAIQLLYVGLSKRINSVLISTKPSVDQEYNSKYRELKKLYFSIDNAVTFIKMKENSRLSKDILTCLKNSLPVLHLNLNENFLNAITVILLRKCKDMDLLDVDWDLIRKIALALMAHSLSWVQVYFYKMLAEMVKSVLLEENGQQTENEKCLTLICDVGILTEICCHGLSSSNKEVENYASEVILYLLRGRLVLSDSCWGRLLASLLPVLPLLHVYAAHDNELGEAVRRSLEPAVLRRLGARAGERAPGLLRLLLARAPPLRLHAAHQLCALLDDSKYLPPRETLRSDILLNALRRIEPQHFNIDYSSSPSKTTQTSGLLQILEVLKQDLTLDSEYMPMVHAGQPTLEPSLRRSTLQQLAVIMRQQELHETFIQYDGIKLIVSILRLSLLVDDYLAFPECAVSCVSVLNSVALAARHELAKLQHLPLLLLRVILVFPANESTVLMAAQILALVVWAGFVLQELDSSRRRIPALPLSVTERTNLPFIVNSYWKTSPNTEHSFVEWLLADESFRMAIRVRWWWVWGGSELMNTACALSPLSLQTSSPAPSPHPRELAALTSASLQHVFPKLLLQLENATSHDQVNEVLVLLESYVVLAPLCGPGKVWPECGRACGRFLHSSPASPRDVTLLDTLLRFIIAYMDYFPRKDGSMSWILTSFIGSDAVIITLLSKDSLYPQQTSQEDIEVTQLRIRIIKVVIRCVVLLEDYNDYSCSRLESLLKILLSCLERIDLKNFHMLGYLNELMRCVRYVVHSRYCKLSEESVILSLQVVSRVLSGCASGAGRKGQACRLDALLALLALLTHTHEHSIPVQRWSESCSSVVVGSVVGCASAERAEVRASALHVLASLSHHAQLAPQLLQCVPSNSLSQFAVGMFHREGEASAARAAAACLLAAISSRTSPHSQVLEREVLQSMDEGNFIDDCIYIFVQFCNDKEYQHNIEPNIPLSVLDRGSELEVRAQKSEFLLSPAVAYTQPPPTENLLAAAADVITNITLYKTSPVQAWNEHGLYRILFRCISCALSPLVHAAVCRALAAATTHKCVRVALANTKDCVYHLLLTLTPVDTVNNLECLSARTQAMLLLAALLSERPTLDAVCELKDKSIFFSTLLQGLQSNENELREAAMHCLSQLARSIVQVKNGKGKGHQNITFLDDLKSPYEDSDERRCAGDLEDCQPEFMVEEICKVLINLLRRRMDDKKYLSGQDPEWSLVSCCLSSCLSASPLSRAYCAHRQLAVDLTRALQLLRDQLTLMGKPVDAIRNANHEPTFATLNWILILMSSLMLENQAAKDRIADDIASSLTRLWPWCMMMEGLRDSVMEMLLIFTNDCPRAWSSMCSCVGSRSLVWCVCSLAAREAARPRPARALRHALRTLTHAAPHHHCRAVVLKSDVLSCLSKLRGRCAVSAAAWWVLCEALCRHADGAAAVLSALSQPALRPAPAALLPALAHAAHHCRLAVLQSPDLLELLSSCLLTGDTAEIVSASRAVWALAANNHRAKLVLRSAGIQTAVQTTLQRLQKSKDIATQRAVELLTYTNTVLQAI